MSPTEKVPEHGSEPAGDKTAPSRRNLLISSLTGVTGIGAGLAAGATLSGDSRPPQKPAAESGFPSHSPVAAMGVSQAGVDRPATPQSAVQIRVLNFAGMPSLSFLAGLGEKISQLTREGGKVPSVTPDGPGDLSVTVGLGPRMIEMLDANLPGAEKLPLFKGDSELPPERLGGDLMLAVYSSDPSVLEPVQESLSDDLPDHTVSWNQYGFRSPSDGTVARNPLGFFDGILVPKTEQEISEQVWINHPTVGNSTICVIRQFQLDAKAFRSLPVAEQEKIIGRKQDTGEPLSGGSREDQVNLVSRSEDGEYIIPARSHVRAAHPSFTGSPLMLRRSYAYDNGAEAGLMFISYQNSLRTFAATQIRMDQMDDLMGYAVARASYTFLILPGFESGKPLGESLLKIS